MSLSSAAKVKKPDDTGENTTLQPTSSMEANTHTLVSHKQEKSEEKRSRQTDHTASEKYDVIKGKEKHKKKLDTESTFSDGRSVERRETGEYSKTTSSKSKQAKDTLVEIVDPGEKDSVQKASSGNKGLMSKLGIFKKKKESKALDKESTEQISPRIPSDQSAPQLTTAEREELEALALLLKSGTDGAPHTEDSPAEEIDPAEYLRAVVKQQGTLLNIAHPAPNGTPYAHTTNVPAPPLSRVGQQLSMMPKVRTSGVGDEPVSDSAVHRRIATVNTDTSNTIAPCHPNNGLLINAAVVPINSSPELNVSDQLALLSDPKRTEAATAFSIQESLNEEAHDSPDTTPSAAHMQQSSQLGAYFYSRIAGGSVDSTTMATERQKELDRQAKKRKEADDESKEKSRMKFNRDDGRFKYKGEVIRMPVDDEKKDNYEILKFSHNSWSGVRYYWAPDGEGRLCYITGETQYLGGWKKGVRHGHGEGSFECKGMEGVYSGDWKGGKPSGNGKFLTKRFTYEGAWKDGQRHGFGEYITERLHYVGDWLADRKHGYGIVTYQDGTRYEGEWEEDQRSGFGVCRYPDGSLYTGMWSDNQRHGQGTSIYTNGNRYVGEWYKDMRQGKGIIYGALHQKIYEGSWWRNKRHGQGTAWFLESGDRYEGEWFLDKQHGEGDWYGVDGSSYKGSYVEGFRHGTGLVIYASGDRYVGEWVRGIREGAVCAYVYKDYGKYIGPYVADKACGQGEYHTFANRVIAGNFKSAIIEDEDGRYTGLTLNGKRYGRGIQLYPNGDRYDGEWREGLRYGYGVMQYEDGARYVGFWLKGERSKLGTYSLPSGEKYIGRWLKDKRHGTGTLIMENNDRLVDAQWANDAPIDGPATYVFANKSVYRGPLKNGLPHGRGSLTMLISVLLKERSQYRSKTGLLHFFRGERQAALAASESDMAMGDEMDFGEDIDAYVDSAKKNKKRTAQVAIFEQNTITFWRDFVDGVLQDGPGFSVWNGNACEGDFTGLERHGIGRMSRTTGEIYYGQWKHDREWGIGEVRTRNMDVYLGYWYNGRRNGIGRQSYDEGGVFNGKWMNDRRHGIGIFVWPDKSMVAREYYQGEFVSKRPVDSSWAQQQLAIWGVERFFSTLKSLQFNYPEWASNGPMPDFYDEAMQSIHNLEDMSIDALRMSRA